LAVKDFTTSTEVDPNNHIDLVGTNHIDFDAWMNEDAYRYWDEGVDHFGDFEHKIDINAVSGDWARHAISWMLSNDLDDACGLRTADKTNIRVHSISWTETLVYLRIYDDYLGDGYNDSYDSAYNTPYYLTLKKISTPTNTLTCKIYLDSDRTNLDDTLTLELHADYKFRYVFACNTWDASQAQHFAEFDIENLDLQEEAGIEYLVGVSAGVAAVSGALTGEWLLKGLSVCGISALEIGAPAIERPATWEAWWTGFNLENPANTSGIIDTIEVWAASNITGFRVGTFYLISGNDYKCRDSVVLGDVAAGAKRTFTGLSLATEAGDYLGCYTSSGTALLERTTTGGAGCMDTAGEHIDPNDQATYTLYAGYTISLYGTGSGIGVEGAIKVSKKIAGIINGVASITGDASILKKIAGAINGVASVAGLLKRSVIIDRQVSASSDDVQRRLGADTFETAPTYFEAGGSTPTAATMYGTGARYTNITAPPGAIIIQSYFSVYAKGNYGAGGDEVSRTRISAEDIDDAPTFTNDKVAFDARWANRTTARVDWDNIPIEVAGNWYDSIDFKSVIQEIVNREGWESGNDIVIFWEDFDDRSAHIYDGRRGGSSYDGTLGPSYAPKLHIEYQPPRKLAGVIAGIATVAGKIIRIHPLAGVVTGIATVSGSLTTGLIEYIKGTASGVATVVGTLSIAGIKDLAGIVSGVCSVTGNLPVSKKIAGAVAGIAAVVGDLTKATPRILVVQPTVKDAYISHGSPNSNFGNYVWIECYDYINSVTRSLLEFDISELPADATITSASLQLYYYFGQFHDPVGKTIWVYKQTHTDWVELEVDWYDYKGTTDWTAFGGDYVTSSPAGDSIVVPADYGWMSWNVLAIVQDAYNNTIPAEFLLKYEDETVTGDEDYAASWFHSKEYTDDTDLQPKLTIGYTAAGIQYLAGIIAGIAAVSGAVKATRRVAGTIAGIAEVSGAVKILKELAGISAGVASVVANLTYTRIKYLAGAISGLATVSGIVKVTREIAGAVTGIASVTGTTKVTHKLAGTISGIATVSGTLFVGYIQYLAGVIYGVATVAGNLPVSKKIAGISAGVATVTGATKILKRLAGLVAGVATVIGRLITRINAKSILDAHTPYESELSRNPQYKSKLDKSPTYKSEIGRRDG